MPIYTFRSKRNKNNIKTLDMPMAEREVWLDAHPQWEQILTVMNIGDAMMLGIVSKEVKEFNKHVIGRMKHGIHGNNLNRSRYGHNIGEV
jgi:hypothetical protein